MKKALALIAIASILAASVAYANIPRWARNNAAAGKHKLYTTTPGDLGRISTLQVTAISTDVTISMHNYSKGTLSTSDDGWVRMDLTAARGDTNLTIFGGETVTFEFDGRYCPEAFYTTGGNSRVWAR